MDCGHGCCIRVACEMDGWMSKPDCRSGTRRNRWIAFRSRNPRYNRAGDPAACAVLRCQCRLPQRRAEDGTSTPGSIESEATTQLSLCRSPFKDALQHIPLRGGGGAPPYYEGTPVTRGERQTTPDNRPFLHARTRFRLPCLAHEDHCRPVFFRAIRHDGPSECLGRSIARLQMRTLTNPGSPSRHHAPWRTHVPREPADAPPSCLAGVRPPVSA